MRSRLFTDFNLDVSADFQRDFKRALALTPTQVQVVAGASGDYLLTRLDRTRQLLCSDLAQKTRAQYGDVRSALEVFSFFLRMLSGDKYAGDTADALFDDLKDSELVAEEQRAIFTTVVDTVRLVSLSTIQEIDKSRVATGLFPSYVSMGTTVELRGVTKPDFTAGDKAEMFEPRLTGLVPIVSVRIDLDSGDHPQIVFQCDEFQLALMMETLKATSKELELLKKHAKNLESPGST